MFCYQCEQRAKGTGCTVVGVCGKDESTAVLQDLLIYVMKGISMYATRARSLSVRDQEIDEFVIKALFTTITNVNFDPERVAELIQKGVALKDKAKKLYEDACMAQGKTPESLKGPAEWQGDEDLSKLIEEGARISEEWRSGVETLGEDRAALRDLILFGLKGAAAYVDHAQILGVQDEKVYGDFHEVLDFLTASDPSLDDLLGTALRVGELNVRSMALLDKANTEAYGDPVPTAVRTTPVAGKAILVSGHDLKDLEELLKQTEGKGINIYTHGEMLPAHGYPQLKKYKHLVGNYGSAWQNQSTEFEKFPGAILMTTNCIQRPKDSYKDRIFTTGLVAWPGVRHIKDKDFTPVIEAALAAEGFAEDEPEKTMIVGFGRASLLGAQDKVVDLVKEGKLRHVFLIGGCDGAKPGRNYYTELAKAVPEDCIILTLACGKYRFNDLEFGEIDGIPRLLDVGQCNDAFSAVQLAVSLAEKLGTDVNSLPLSLILSWYEQKAVAILLSLLYLGIKNIRLGPTLPAFVTPNVLEVLVEKFGIMPISTPEEDLKAILGA
ncbi:MAG: hydroxylamine reductase [Bacillota bacterium]|jgi:hydroxylamine reductase|nr:hydroxylamine reductase [Bacillota bacterium]MDI9416060.1 hydroxylamine reductase [Bacillota bacterium]NLD13216.1 hydroxylamine reductase [Bacillota bacterium]HAV21044.1 hydroxylamine reductase [Bacillota bacterium]HCD41970.1 hydroxylamine reductase [Bacillota bacterium]